MCGCSNSNSNCDCGCDTTNSGDIVFDGQNFICQDSFLVTLFEVNSGEKLNAVLLTLMTQICTLLNNSLVPNAGTVWYSDIGMPDPTTGDVGDFYLRQSNGDVYQKVDPADWGSAITNLRGTSGSDGSDGTSFRFGAGIPSDSLGIDGDSYIDTSISTLELYTKAVGTWTDTGLT